MYRLETKHRSLCIYKAMLTNCLKKSLIIYKVEEYISVALHNTKQCALFKIYVIIDYFSKIKFGQTDPLCSNILSEYIATINARNVTEICFLSYISYVNYVPLKYS